ncbi:TlpA disulfide reductase family protein [Arenimonas sp. GDDSR-1]|uniref:TlpA family protein disulfide reductase n=1 Tax=Arenimonas sp. GDDSR-1 TaxID=2950125 RepID=UPI002628DDFF|nr:TlpA disulfide reductase family protein [Arenimonas sp. GDDSR-1]
MKPLKVLVLAVLAALLGLAAGMFIAGPGILLRTDLGQALFERVVPPKYPAPGGATAIGETVRPFTVTGFDGQARSLPAPGRWQLINYWASWCGPCRVEMPWLDALHADRQGHVDIIGIALETPESAQTLLSDIPVRFAQHHEPPGASDSSVLLGNAWGVLPFTVLIDPQGRLVKRHIGVFAGEAQLRDWLVDGMADNRR